MFSCRLLKSGYVRMWRGGALKTYAGGGHAPPKMPRVSRVRGLVMVGPAVFQSSKLLISIAIAPSITESSLGAFSRQRIQASNDVVFDRRQANKAVPRWHGGTPQHLEKQDTSPTFCPMRRLGRRPGIGWPPGGSMGSSIPLHAIRVSLINHDRTWTAVPTSVPPNPVIADHLMPAASDPRSQLNR
ncbi:hypothetical protein VFPPC_15120 [Pochonia chlamydosporia 170]|uniref:Uncharacterized protein n=1 Tax=Pochonia chlamydosporia 170 TaxID=1380566 RepID=A0A179G4K7_METCM|nr:hypothetical protein VFPPC_15120 [Pochonia chlamydosporia 170]OAQ72398.1 hypothetical protein VFPPC_15120 [Pochonia chlamydosporia 170]